MLVLKLWFWYWYARWGNNSNNNKNRMTRNNNGNNNDNRPRGVMGISAHNTSFSKQKQYIPIGICQFVDFYTKNLDLQMN